MFLLSTIFSRDALVAIDTFPELFTLENRPKSPNQRG